MGRYFKLIDAVEEPATLNVTHRQNGTVNYSQLRLEPGKKYELGDDDIFVDSIKNAKIRKQYTRELVSKLEVFGIPYEEICCKSCGGRIKKISYAIVEVVEE